MDDETFEKLVQEAEKLDFKTEEEAKAYFDEQLKDWSRTRIRKRKVTVDKREQEDPYYAMLKTEAPIESRYMDHFDIDDEAVHRYWDEVERSIGRYPDGFRHFENYENYRVVYPDSTIQDYHNESKDLK
jgi:hypothetical protein